MFARSIRLPRFCVKPNKNNSSLLKTKPQTIRNSGLFPRSLNKWSLGVLMLHNDQFRKTSRSAAVAALVFVWLGETGVFPVSVKKTVVLFVAVSREIISYRHVITSIYSRLQSSLNTFVTDYFLSHVFRRFETAHVHAHASRACQLARNLSLFPGFAQDSRDSSAKVY